MKVLKKKKKKDQVWGNLELVRSKRLFSQTTLGKTFEKNSALQESLDLYVSAVFS